MSGLGFFNLFGGFGLLLVVFLLGCFGLGLDILALLYKLGVLTRDLLECIPRGHQLFERGCSEQHVDERHGAARLVHARGAIAQAFLQLGDALLGSLHAIGRILGGRLCSLVFLRCSLEFGIRLVKLGLQRIDAAHDVIRFSLLFGARYRKSLDGSYQPQRGNQ